MSRIQMLPGPIDTDPCRALASVQADAASQNWRDRAPRVHDR